MFSHIKTSKENKEVVTKLTNKLNLGAENVIARIALAYSLAQEEKLDLEDMKDSGGKEYSKSVLFGDNFDIYIGLISTKYGLHVSDNNMSKYVKIHLDKGLNLVEKEFEQASNNDLINFLDSQIKRN